MHYARINNSDTVSLWGDGTPTRDFLYVDDAAEGIVLSCEKYEDTDPLNLGSGNEVSIKELAETINKLMKTNLKINWETDKPNGQPRRCIDSTKASTKIGFKQKTDLETGLFNTIKWF